MSNQSMTVSKFTLSSGKFILVRDGRIEDVETSTQVAGKLADKENTIHMGLMLQKEMIKKLVVAVGQKGQTVEELKMLKMSEKEDLNNLFTLKEYMEVAQSVQSIAGEPEKGKLQMESVTFGDK